MSDARFFCAHVCRYAVALLAEWLSPARHAALLTALGIEVDASGEVWPHNMLCRAHRTMVSCRLSDSPTWLLAYPWTWHYGLLQRHHPSRCRHAYRQPWGQATRLRDCPSARQRLFQLLLTSAMPHLISMYFNSCMTSQAHQWRRHPHSSGRKRHPTVRRSASGCGLLIPLQHACPALTCLQDDASQRSKCRFRPL